jgi:hypothetical protein
MAMNFASSDAYGFSDDAPDWRVQNTKIQYR